MSKAVVSAKFNKELTNVRLVVSTNQDLSNPIYSPEYSTTNNVAKLEITGLDPNTQYYYGVSIKGVLQQNGRGKFKTFPSGASNFTCAFSSCAGGSNVEVFNTIRNLNPLFFLHMGDIHYDNITANDVGLYRNGFDNVFAVPQMQDLYKDIPTPYMWDDHDYSNNNSYKDAVPRNAACLAYRERVPHYMLPEGDGAKPVYQSFVCGRVRFIMTDLRSMKSNPLDPDTSAKTMMGETQIQWFFNELLQPEPLKVWMSSVPWVGEPDPYSDFWNGYTTERTRIANFIKDKNLQGRVIILSGDMHGMAIDDGTNGDYADGGGAAIPTFIASPLSSPESEKGGPWSHGSYLNGTSGGQYGVMNIVDTEADITVEWIGKRMEETLVTLTINVDGATYIPPEEVTFQQPSDIEGLALWIDAETSPMTMNESNVAQIEDLSGLGHHAQATGSAQPLLTQNAQGKNVLRFNGTSQQLQNLTYSPFISNETTVFVVADFGTESGHTTILDLQSNASASPVTVDKKIALYRTSSDFVAHRPKAAYGTGAKVSATSIPSEMFIASSVVKGMNNDLYIDGVYKYTDSHGEYTTADYNTIDGYRLGNRFGSNSFFTGDIGEVIIFDRALSTEEIANIHNYLKEKWNIS